MSIMRTLAKQLIHGAIVASGLPARQRDRFRCGLIILTYHSFCERQTQSLFNSLPVHRFDRQLEFIKGHFDVVPLTEGIENICEGRQRSKPCLAITIDDGFRDNYTLAWPLLRRHRIPVTVFLATDFLDKGRPPWPTQIVEMLDRTEQRRLGYPFKAAIVSRRDKIDTMLRIMDEWKSTPAEERFIRLERLEKHLGVKNNTANPPMSWDQVMEMSKGGMSFGAHSVYHSILTEIDKDDAWEEIRKSRERLENELKVPCTLFAYPNGNHNPETKEMLKSVGMTIGVTQESKINTVRTDRLELGRIEVPFHDPLVTFKVRASGLGCDDLPGDREGYHRAQ